MSFLHGIEVVELNGGPRPIETSKSAVIGLVGTAARGPVNIPTLVAGSKKEAVSLFGPSDGVSTIPDALAAIFDQIGAAVVVVNVQDQEELTAEEKTHTFDSGNTITLDHDYIVPGSASGSISVKSSDEVKVYKYNKDYSIDCGVLTPLEGGDLIGELDEAVKPELKISYNYLKKADASKIIGGVNEKSGDYEGIQALLAAESVVHLSPRLLIAPGFTGKTDDSGGITSTSKTVIDKLLEVAERLRAVVISDGPDKTDAVAKNVRSGFDNPRLFMVDPYIKVYNPVLKKDILQPPSARVAGIIAKSDNQRGFWYSPSNRPVAGITGTSRAVDFAMGDINARANLLNENNIATIIHQDGYRLWGNRSCCSDKKWMYLSVRRTADMINDALMRSHLWAVDENITSSYIENVVRGVNNFLRHLKSIGAIIGGECWADPELNTPDQIQLGNVTFNFDFTPPYPAEHITFQSSLVNHYLEEVV